MTISKLTLDLIPDWNGKITLACVHKLLWENCQKVLYLSKIITFEEPISVFYLKTLTHIGLTSSFWNSALLAYVIQCATNLKSTTFNGPDSKIVSVGIFIEIGRALVGKSFVIRAPTES